MSNIKEYRFDSVKSYDEISQLYSRFEKDKSQFEMVVISESSDKVNGLFEGVSEFPIAIVFLPPTGDAGSLEGIWNFFNDINISYGTDFIILIGESLLKKIFSYSINTIFKGIFTGKGKGESNFNNNLLISQLVSKQFIISVEQGKKIHKFKFFNYFTENDIKEGIYRILKTCNRSNKAKELNYVYDRRDKKWHQTDNI